MSVAFLPPSALQSPCEGFCRELLASPPMVLHMRGHKASTGTSILWAVFGDAGSCLAPSPCPSPRTGSVLCMCARPTSSSGCSQQQPWGCRCCLVGAMSWPPGSTAGQRCANKASCCQLTNQLLMALCIQQEQVWAPWRALMCPKLDAVQAAGAEQRLLCAFRLRGLAAVPEPSSSLRAKCGSGTEP